MTSDDTPTADESPDRRAGNGTDLTRRSVLEYSVAGLGAAGLGSVATAPAGAQSSDDELPPPENVRWAWRDGDSGAVTWDWPGDVCGDEISKFDVDLHAEVEGSSYTTDSSTVATNPADVEHASYLLGHGQYEEFEARIAAVDEDWNGSTVTKTTLSTEPVEPDYVLELKLPPWSIGDGTTQPAKIVLEPRHDGDGTLVNSLDVELEVRAPCVASVGDVTVPDSDLELEGTTREGEHGIGISVSGPSEPVLGVQEVAELEIEFHEPAETYLSLEADADVLVQEAPDAFDEVEASEFVARGAAVEVHESPPTPTSLHRDWQNGGVVGLGWDWPGDLCDHDLAGYEVTVETPDGTTSEGLAPEQPGYEFLLREGGETVVEVEAVDEDGVRSPPVTERYPATTVDPQYTLEPLGAGEFPKVGETSSVPIEFGPVAGDDPRLVRCEIEASVAAPCVASVEDATASPEGWEVVETTRSDDGGSLTFVAEGPVLEDVASEEWSQIELARVELAGHEPGEVLFDVDDVSMVGLSPDYTVEEFESFREQSDDGQSSDDVDFADLVRELDATATWQVVDVAGNPPPVSGDARPRDLNDDGLFRDVTGDGEVTMTDVVEFFENAHTSSVQDHAQYYDFTGNGTTGHGDIVELFRYVATQS